MRIVARVTAPKRRKNVMIVELEEVDEKFELREESVAKFHLRAGQQLEDAQWDGILRADQVERCRTQAWKLLSLRLRSRKELERALRQRAYEATVVEEVLGTLEEKKFIDDDAFAKQFALERAGRKQGRHRIERELVARGIKREPARQSAGDASSPAQQEESARALLTKWNRRTKPDDPQKRTQAAAAFLLRRGFDGELVWKLIRETFSKRIRQEHP